MDNENHNFQDQVVIDTLLTKLCHDLINPLGSAQMALEEQELEYLDTSLKEAIIKVDMYRFLFRQSIDDDLQFNKIENFIATTNKNIKINHIHPRISALLFYLSEKTLEKSEIIVNQDQIEIDYLFFNEKEIKAINGQFESLDTGNIFIYLAYLQYKRYYTTHIEALENNKWIIQIKNISTLEESKLTD